MVYIELSILPWPAGVTIVLFEAISPYIVSIDQPFKYATHIYMCSTPVITTYSIVFLCHLTKSSIICFADHQTSLHPTHQCFHCYTDKMVRGCRARYIIRQTDDYATVRRQLPIFTARHFAMLQYLLPCWYLI